MRTKTLVAAVALGAASLGACSDGGGSSDGSRQDLVDAMVSEGATEEQANCVVDALGDDARRIYEADDADLSSDDLSKLIDAMTECVGLDELMGTDTGG